ncbi:DUF3748 domain-containing protein [Algoriphagus aquimarinus]|uniref:DUF3748 domain-containing protein n=1 Tax=Algoriphagus aquimarinus TaxID=237018 RepID=UPI001749914D|nr:DUF3748 domain-containing protein [Algoriphagus aquimarinus]
MNTQNETLDTIEIVEIQLTSDPSGHFLNQRQAFSPDDKLLVFDNRNDDSKIGENASIQVVDVETQEVKTIYQLENQTVFGPGTGAVSFHPSRNEVVFIHGLMNASQEQPYGFTARVAKQVSLDESNKSEAMEARDVQVPFTKGALRGGSHAYSYSSDGRFVSFTYNDQVLESESKVNPAIKDLRTVGAFILGERVAINGKVDDENFDGTSFAVLLAEVTADPKPGSDQVDKAYEECWVGNSGYTKLDGTRQNQALVFLGDVVSETGEKVTEVFIADISSSISELISSVDGGSLTSLPTIPVGVKQRRLTFTADQKFPGVQGPRQWLRSSPDGDSIYFYQKDDAGIVQIYTVSPNGGEIKAITKNTFSPDTSFSLSSDGKYLAYGAKEAIYITGVSDGITQQVLAAPDNSNTNLSNINWSNTGHILAYNRKVDLAGKSFFQIFTINLSNVVDK